ncbi:MAG: glycosyltransferase family 2 protein [Candidatus Binatia bacterium]
MVVPFYNAEKHIEECINALLAQSYRWDRYEIIMVDNNSTDRSTAIVGRYPRINLLSEQRQGAYAARNRGVGASRGAIIVFTDADRVACSEWLQEIASAMGAPEVRLIQGGRLYAVKSPALSMLESYDSERAAFTFSRNTREIYYGYTNNMAVRREVFDRCGPFLEVARGADSLFVHRVIAEYSCENVRYLRNARIRHLEITTVRQWMRKRFIYGRSFQRNYNRRKGSFRPLSAAESSAIFKGTIRRSKHSLLYTVCLTGLLWIGSLVYILGCYSGRRTTGMHN